MEHAQPHVHTSEQRNTPYSLPQPLLITSGSPTSGLASPATSTQLHQVQHPHLQSPEWLQFAVDPEPSSPGKLLHHLQGEENTPTSEHRHHHMPQLLHAFPVYRHHQYIVF
jgi:hypothetical protein